MHLENPENCTYPVLVGMKSDLTRAMFRRAYRAGKPVSEIVGSLGISKRTAHYLGERDESATREQTFKFKQAKPFGEKENMTTTIPTFNLDDDLEFNNISIPVGAKPKTTTNATAATLATAVAPPAPNGEADEYSFDDQDIAQAVKPSDGLTTIKISKGEVARFAFVPNFKILRKSVHYVEGSGTIVCVSTKDAPQVCCKKGGQPKDKFVGLVFRYLNVDSKTGKFAAGAVAPVLEVQCVRMSRSNMRDILDACEDSQSPYDLDFRMRHDESRSFGYRFSKAGSKAAWRTIEKDALAMAAPFAADKSKLESRLGKKLNATELNALFSSTATQSSTASVENMLSTLESE